MHAKVAGSPASDSGVALCKLCDTALVADAEL